MQTTTLVANFHVYLGQSLDPKGVHGTFCKLLQWYFYRAKLRVARYCHGKLSVRPSVCDVEVS